MQESSINGKMHLVIKLKHYVTRLSKGDDLKKSIIDFCENNKIKAGAIISAVGSLYEIRLRKADRQK